jgi:hypothetical protein
LRMTSDRVDWGLRQVNRLEVPDELHDPVAGAGCRPVMAGEDQPGRPGGCRQIYADPKDALADIETADAAYGTVPSELFARAGRAEQGVKS